jgi:hypothetical protein
VLDDDLSYMIAKLAKEMPDADILQARPGREGNCAGHILSQGGKIKCLLVDNESQVLKILVSQCHSVNVNLADDCRWSLFSVVWIHVLGD